MSRVMRGATGSIAVVGAALGLALLALAASGCGGSRPSPGPRRTRPSASPLAKSVVRTAKSYLAEEEKGRPTPRDCSDFVGKVFLENGMRLPRTVVEMSLLGARVSSARDLSMGDLLFFSGERVGRIVGHVGIYVGNGIFIHVSRPEAGVTLESLYSDYYRRRYLSARRVIGR